MPKFLERLFVWTGGALFVGSLGLTAWMYAVRFRDTSQPFAGWAEVALDTALIALFASHHSLFARAPVKRAMAAFVPERLLRSVYVWMASSLLVFICLAWRPVGGCAYQVTGWLALPFVAAQAGGVAMIASSVTAIHPLELAGIRRVAVREALQHGGVYSLVRHPLYLGWALIVFGAARMTGDRLAFAIITTLYLLVAIPWEEQSLEQEFGEAYRSYKRQVPWRFIPYVY